MCACTMVYLKFPSNFCYNIIVLVPILFSSAAGEVNKIIVPDNSSLNQSSFHDNHLFSYNTLENGSKWIVPRFPFNHNENFTFCRNNQTIRVPVRQVLPNTSIITIPCYTVSYGFLDGIDILLYKGSPDTTLTPISGNASQQGGILEYVRYKGFRYNLTNDWTDKNIPLSGKFTCFFANSSGENYLITEYYRDDNAVEIYSRDCSLSYRVNERGIFLCETKGIANETDFQWSFKLVDGDEFEPVINLRKKQKYSKDGVVGESVRVTLRNPFIIEVGCRVKRNSLNETFQTWLPIQIQELEIPIVLDNTTVEINSDSDSGCKVVKMRICGFDEKSQGLLASQVEDALKPIVLDNDVTFEQSYEPGINLTCSFEAESTGSTYVQWIQDGYKKLDDFAVVWTSPIRTTTLMRSSSINTTTNYTCIVSNDKGFSSKTFVVFPKPLPNFKPIDQSPSQQIYIYIVAAFTTITLLALVVEWKKRYAIVKNVKSKLKKLEINDRNSNSPAIQLNEDSTNWTIIGSGAYGQVWHARVKMSNTNEIVDVVAKSIMWHPTLRRKTAKLLFDDFINEITYHGKLNSGNSEDYRKRYIVKYLGFYAPDVRYFRVYLILDHCNPGQLLSFLHKYKDERFFNDINGSTMTYRYEHRLRQEEIRGDSCLGISHLMKWAEQIALAMEYLHCLKIVHRDLADRNILLKGPNDWDSVDEVVAQLADFGLSRSVEHSKNYVITQKLKTKPRNLPLLWYPPESIGFGADVEYTTKSDVWSFGVMLWEMFSLGKHPYEGYRLIGKIQEVPFRKGLRTKKLELRRLDLKKIPDEIWALMQRCWLLRPDDRPDFSEIYQILRNINLSFGLVATEDPINADDGINHDQSTTQNQISSVEDNEVNEIHLHEDSREIVLTNLVNSQNISRSHASNLENVHSTENQAPVHSDENTITVWCQNEYVQD